MHILQVLLLAAGASRRFGSNKLLQHIETGVSVLDRSYHAASALHATPLLVISDDPALRIHCEERSYPYLINAQAAHGMTSSIVCGVRATAGAGGWAICLADMPCIRQQTMVQLRETWDGERILLPRYREQAGHPVIFPREYFAQLTALQGDQGARRVVQDSSDVVYLDVADPGVLLDIDTPADLQQAIYLSEID